MGEASFWDASPRAVLEVCRQSARRRKEDRLLEDWRTGTIAAEVANANQKIEKKGGGRWEPRDFFPNLPEPEREPMDWRMMKAILSGWSGPEITTTDQEKED